MKNKFDLVVADSADKWLADHGQPTNTDLRRQMAMVSFDRANDCYDAIEYLMEMRAARTTWCGGELALMRDVDRIIELYGLKP